jgi:hypothetical protein
MADMINRRLSEASLAALTAGNEAIMDRLADLEAAHRSKVYRNDKEVKAGLGADGRWHVETQGGAFGTILVDGSTLAEAVADLIEAMEAAAW